MGDWRDAEVTRPRLRFTGASKHDHAAFWAPGREPSLQRAKHLRCVRTPSRFAPRSARERTTTTASPRVLSSWRLARSTNCVRTSSQRFSIPATCHVAWSAAPELASPSTDAATLAGWLARAARIVATSANAQQPSPPRNPPDTVTRIRAQRSAPRSTFPSELKASISRPVYLHLP